MSTKLINPDNPLRSPWGRIAGTGVMEDDYNEGEAYVDIKVNCVLPNQYLTDEQLKSLSGPVKTYRIS
jgi:hypothetical protein